MSALRRRKRKHNTGYYSKPSSQNNYFLVVFLSLVVFFETIVLLFLIPKTPATKTSQTAVKKKVKIEVKAEPRKTVSQKETLITKIIPKKIKGKIAIVIDDWGYNYDKEDLEVLNEIKLPVTLAILPFRNYSEEIAWFAHENNYEVLIHMPMEPHNKVNVDLEPKTLMVGMSAQTINKILNEAFLDIPYAKGINNHMGSLATEDRQFITTVFKELKKHNLYFLDSFVVRNSVCQDIAKSMGIKFAKRSIFLDNESSYAYIRGQLMELVREVDRKGQAIGIGHDRSNTLKVLKEVMPQLAEEGYKFVFVSEIVK
ncbi:MAG: divergent polysaccharide deacetylase family protein [Candidatus Omnitrophica bacterium]|nr:divergent polysaccharide deacetylase family protein [Candidatus Omnitrophota bacterium]